MCERELETEQNCSILTPTLLAIIAFLSCSPVLLNRGPGGPASMGAGFLYHIFSPTDWTSCAPSYIIVRHLPSSCGHHKSHSFNPTMVNAIFWYSLTGCTCYLHRCISYFDSPAGSEVNIQQVLNISILDKEVFTCLKCSISWFIEIKYNWEMVNVLDWDLELSEFEF